MNKKRDFSIIQNKIENLQNIEVTKPLYINYHRKKLPIYMLKLEKYKKNPWILIASGCHGEEPGAVYALLESIPILKEYSYKYNFLLFPVMNPYGYIAKSRFVKYTKKKRCNEANLNFQFHDKTKNKIAKYIMKQIEKYKPIVSLDCHEDDACKYLSLFERTEGTIKPINLLELSNIVELYTKATCYGDPVEKGVILSKVKEETLEYYSFTHGSKISITLELPGKKDLYFRILVGKEAIKLILKKLGGKKL